MILAFAWLANDANAQLAANLSIVLLLSWLVSQILYFAYERGKLRSESNSHDQSDTTQLYSRDSGQSFIQKNDVRLQPLCFEPIFNTVCSVPIAKNSLQTDKVHVSLTRRQSKKDLVQYHPSLKDAPPLAVGRIAAFLNPMQRLMLSSTCARLAFLTLFHDQTASIAWEHVDFSGERYLRDDELVSVANRVGHHMRSLTLQGNVRLSGLAMDHLISCCDSEPMKSRNNIASMEIQRGLKSLRVHGEGPGQVRGQWPSSDLGFSAASTTSQVTLTNMHVNSTGIQRLLMKNHQNLQSLQLINCSGIDDLVAQAISSSCPNIHLLALPDSSITDLGLSCILSSCSHLKQLFIRNCRGVSDVAFTHFRGQTQCCEIQEIDVDGCINIGDGFASWLSREGQMLDFKFAQANSDILHAKENRRRNFLSLSCSRTNISDAGVLCIVEGCGQSLQTLLLDDCKITDKALQSVSEHCLKLQRLSCNGCSSISDIGVDKLLNSVTCSKEIKALELSGCSITEACIERLIVRGMARISHANTSNKGSASFESLLLALGGGIGEVDT